MKFERLGETAFLDCSRCERETPHEWLTEEEKRIDPADGRPKDLFQCCICHAWSWLPVKYAEQLDTLSEKENDQ